MDLTPVGLNILRCVSAIIDGIDLLFSLASALFATSCVCVPVFCGGWPPLCLGFRDCLIPSSLGLHPSRAAFAVPASGPGEP